MCISQPKCIEIDSKNASKKHSTPASQRARLHARERMLEREITFQEVRESLENSKIIEKYSDDRPFPSFLALGLTSNNRPLHTVWALKNENLVYLISVYEPDPNMWIDFKERKK